MDDAIDEVAAIVPIGVDLSAVVRDNAKLLALYDEVGDALLTMRGASGLGRNPTLLHMTAAAGHVQNTEFLIGLKVDLNAGVRRNSIYTPPVSYAAESYEFSDNQTGIVDCVKLILDAGATVTTRMLSQSFMSETVFTKLMLQYVTDPAVLTPLEFDMQLHSDLIDDYEKALETATRFQRRKALLRFGIAAGDAGHKARVAAQRKRGIEPGPDFY